MRQMEGESRTKEFMPFGSDIFFKCIQNLSQPLHKSIEKIPAPVSRR